MIEPVRAAIQRVCPHDYELLWVDVSRRTRAFECRYCGKQHEE